MTVRDGREDGEVRGRCTADLMRERNSGMALWRNSKLTMIMMVVMMMMLMMVMTAFVCEGEVRVLHARVLRSLRKHSSYCERLPDQHVTRLYHATSCLEGRVVQMQT